MFGGQLFELLLCTGNPEQGFHLSISSGGCAVVSFIVGNFHILCSTY